MSTGRQDKAEHSTELDTSERPVVRDHGPGHDMFDQTDLGNQSASVLEGKLEATLDMSMPSMTLQPEISVASSEECGALENSDVPMCEETENSGGDEVDTLEEESRGLSPQESARAQSESWFDVTGVNNIDPEYEEPSLKCSQRSASPESGSNQSACSRVSNQDSDTDLTGDDAEYDESRFSNRLAMSRDSMARPRAKNAAEKLNAFEDTESSYAETSVASTKAKSSKSRRSTMVDSRNEMTNSIEESECTATQPQVLSKQLSPCLEVSSDFSSIRSERRTFEVVSADSSSAPSSRRTFDVLSADSSSVHPSRRTFDVPPDDSSSPNSRRRTFDVVQSDSAPAQSTRRTFDASPANGTYSVHQTTQVS